MSEFRGKPQRGAASALARVLHAQSLCSVPPPSSPSDFNKSLLKWCFLFRISAVSLNLTTNAA